MTENPDLVLKKLRGSIDNIDSALVFLLAERFCRTRQVGDLKAKNNMPVADLEREKKQIDRLRSLAMSANLDPDFLEKWFNFVVAEVKCQNEKLSNLSL